VVYRLHKITNPKEVERIGLQSYRSISLLAHASKILIKMITRRIEGKVKDHITKTQFSFRNGEETREAIGVMRMLKERSIDCGNKVYVSFVDFEDAFHRVDGIQIMTILKNI